MVLDNIAFGMVASAAAWVAWYRRACRDDSAGSKTEEESEAATGVTTRTTPLRSACVFCGSRAPPGTLGVLVQREARSLAQLFVQHGVDLVYGGGSVGVMGMIASSVDAAGGKVTGIIPKALQPKEASGDAIQPDNVIIVDSMHTRKRMMAERSDVFVALPGGFGTFEEVMEMITWTQLGIQRKTVALLNVGGFYDKLLEFLDHAVQNGFISRDRFEGILVHAPTAQQLFDIIASHVPPKGYLDWTADSS